MNEKKIKKGACNKKVYFVTQFDKLYEDRRNLL